MVSQSPEDELVFRIAFCVISQLMLTLTLTLRRDEQAVM